MKIPAWLKPYTDAGLEPAFVLSALGKMPKAPTMTVPPHVESKPRRTLAQEVRPLTNVYERRRARALSDAPPPDTVARRPWPTRGETAEARIASLAPSGTVPKPKRKPRKLSAPVVFYVAGEALAPSHGHSSIGLD